MQNTRLVRSTWLKALSTKGGAAVSALYVTFYGGMAASSVLLNVYLQSLGFSGLQIASFSSISPAIRMAGQPIWGVIADTWGRRRTLLLTVFMATLAMLAYAWPGNYLYFLLLAIFNTVFSCPILTLVDSMALDHLDTHPDASFGSLRVWGSVGYAVMALLSGAVVAGRDIRLAFVLGAVVLGGGWLLVWRHAPGARRSTGLKRDWSSAGQVLRSRGLIAFLALVIVLHLGTSSLMTFAPIYMRELGATPEVISTVVGIRTLGELPVLFLVGRLVARIGPKKVIVLAMVTYAAQSLGYSVSHTPLPAILVDLTHGLPFGLMLVGSIEYLNSHVPSTWRATGQAIYSAANGGAGAIVGNLWAGTMYDALGARTLFRLNGFILIGIALVALIALQTGTAGKYASPEGSSEQA